MSRIACGICVLALCAAPVPLAAQNAVKLPPITITATKQKGKPKAARAVARPAPQAPSPEPAPAAPPASLTVPTTTQARAEIQRTPGAVEVVPDTAFKNSPAQTVKDVLDYVPGVFAQPKWGEDTRLSIRGSGLSRNFHLRGIQLYMDGIPINTADGYGDFQEIDPTAYRHVEVYKGANALRFGANSLGGAINFVMPTGRDASLAEGRLDGGSFGFRRAQASSGAAFGPWDYFVTGAWTAQDGFRHHSDGESVRGAANAGYRLSEDAETRFYVNANEIRQRIPGAVSKAIALNAPRTAAAINEANDWQSNVDSLRVANRTVFNLGPTRVEVGVFGVDRHLMHPIFQWLDYRYADHGAFTRAVDERVIFGHRNRLITGINIHNGRIDNRQFVNGPNAQKGALLSSSLDTAHNVSAYLENAFYVLPSVALIGGTQYLYATRERRDRFLSNGDQSGETEFSLFSPKGGVLWDVAPGAQVFANVSRSAEVPSFGESSSFPAPIIPFTSIKAQTATTYELGTRGDRPDLRWDLAVYRAEIRNELQCLYASFGNCNVVNADRTIHQGIEAGLGFAALRDLFATAGLPAHIWVNLAYTLNDFRFDGDAVFGDNLLPGAPRHFLRAEALFKHASGFYIGPNVEWLPEAYYVDSANTLTTEAYAIWGLKAGYDAGGPVTAYVEARNLAKKAYIASASIIDRVTSPTMPLFEPGTGRGVYAGLRVRW